MIRKASSRVCVVQLPSLACPVRSTMERGRVKKLFQIHKRNPDHYAPSKQSSGISILN